jgi:hypothetical protein
MRALCVKESMEFNDNYGVYICPHIFKKESAVFVGLRDPDGYWQFFCEDESCPESSEPHLVGVGHLTSEDPTINELTSLQPNSFAQRIHVNADWEFGELE